METQAVSSHPRICPGVMWVRSIGKEKKWFARPWSHGNKGMRGSRKRPYPPSHWTDIIRRLLFARGVLALGWKQTGHGSFLANGRRNLCLTEEIRVHRVRVRACLRARVPGGPLCCCAIPCCGALWLSVRSFLFQTSFSRGFTTNMKLEAVNPRNPGELCVASVVSVKGRLMWLHLEGTHRWRSFWGT